MKKYFVSILIASMFLILAPFMVNQAKATDISIKDFINLLVAIGVITPDKMPAVNAFLAAQNSTHISTPSVSNRVVTPIITTPSINILSPDGGETYKNDGSPITVNWQTKNIPPSFRFDVIRLRGYPNGGETVLATNVLNDGHQVVYPTNIPDGAYTLEVKGYHNDVLVMDSSDSYFKIVSVPSQPSNVDINNSTTTVFIPIVGMNGSWKLKLTANGQDYLSIANLSQNGTSYSGTSKDLDSNGVPNGNTYSVSGYISGSDIYEKWVRNTNYIVYLKGSLNSEGTTYSGTWTDTSGNKGTFTSIRRD